MKPIVIDDDQRLKEYNISGLADEIFVSTLGRNNEPRKLYDVAAEIAGWVSTDSILFINLFLRCADPEFDSLQAKAGIALIKFIRLQAIDSPIILISPYSAPELVRQNPTDLIVLSPGITVLEGPMAAPDKWKETIQSAAFEHAIKQKFNTDLKPYIQVGFRSPEDDRHSWANWWGIDRLWSIHLMVEGETMGINGEQPGKKVLFKRWESADYPSFLKGKIKELISQQALYLYGHRPEAINYSLNKLRNRERQINKLYQERIEADKLRQQKQTNLHTLMEAKLDGEKIIREREKIDKGKNRGNTNMQSYKPKREDFNPAIEQAETEIKKAEEKISQIDAAIKEVKNDIYGLGQSESYRQTSAVGVKQKSSPAMNKIHPPSGEQRDIYKIREVLRERQPKIYYIDDQANEGWADVFQRMIYGCPSESFKVATLHQPFEANERLSVYVEIRNMKPQPQLILLDLRLLKERGIQRNIDNLSGAEVLKDLKERQKDIPILMVTASNKAWSFERLHKLQCNGYWVKEGLDERATEEDSVENYVQFLELVETLTKPQNNK